MCIVTGSNIDCNQTEKAEKGSFELKLGRYYFVDKEEFNGYMSEQFNKK